MAIFQFAKCKRHDRWAGVGQALAAQAAQDAAGYGTSDGLEAFFSVMKNFPSHPSDVCRVETHCDLGIPSGKLT